MKGAAGERGCGVDGSHTTGGSLEHDQDLGLCHESNEKPPVGFKQGDAMIRSVFCKDLWLRRGKQIGGGQGQLRGSAKLRTAVVWMVAEATDMERRDVQQRDLSD